MSKDFQTNSQLSLTPLGAGDLIDRAVRFYRKNFWTFILIAAPPILVGTIFSVGWTMLGREMFSGDSYRDDFEKGVYYIYLWLGNFLIFLTEAVAVIVVMGGASRNFVRHLLFGEPITFKETYRNTWKRLGGLLVASVFITILLGVIGYFIFLLGLVLGMVAVGLAAWAFSFLPFLASIVSLVLGLVFLFGTFWVFFLLASRFAYVPQVMLVEGQGVFSAIARSTALASGNVKRFAALFIFTIVAAYSALALFYVPLVIYAWSNGVNIFSFDADLVPASYQIAAQFISQASFILLSPIWTVGLCLLYVDERVRHEGYDIELMAAQRLGEIPAVPQEFVNPLQPALANQNAPVQNVNQARKSSYSTLGLD